MNFRNTNYYPGIRQNNPGNIVKGKTNWQGKVPENKLSEREKKSRFEVFESTEYGLRALMKNAITWVNRGENTVNKLIHKWAPPFENKTQSYINAVAKKLNINENEPLTLDKAQLIALTKAITEHENGTQSKLIPQSSYEQAYQMLGIYDIKKK